jgi:hypothetical protein
LRKKKNLRRVGENPNGDMSHVEKNLSKVYSLQGIDAHFDFSSLHGIEVSHFFFKKNILANIQKKKKK